MYFYALVALTIFVFLLLAARIWQESRTIQPVVKDWPDPKDDPDYRPPPSDEEFLRLIKEEGWVRNSFGWERPRSLPSTGLGPVLRGDGWREVHPWFWLSPDE